MTSESFPRLALLQIALALLTFAGGSRALAQPASAGDSGAHPIFYAAPPAGFDAVAAGDAELAQYGIPPRPERSSPAFAVWLKLVTTSQTRLTNPKWQITDIVNGTPTDLRLAGELDNTTLMNNSSWNAYAVTGPNGYFKLNSSWVASSWDEPGIGTEFCAYGPFIAGQWVGLDGLNDNDVLQAGVSVSGCPTAYVAWYEWYTLGCTSNEAGCSQTNLDIPINVNDEVNVEVWYTTAAPNGHAYIWDQTTQQSVSVGFNQPSGDPGSGYAGNSAEVVVERPLTYSGLANLANYTPFYMQGCAVDSYACGGNPAWTNYNVTMTCPPWNPSNWCPSGGANLSVVNLNTESWLLYFTPGGPTLQ